MNIVELFVQHDFGIFPILPWIPMLLLWFPFPPPPSLRLLLLRLRR
jgi:hypothetical protein